MHNVITVETINMNRTERSRRENDKQKKYEKNMRIQRAEEQLSNNL